MSLANIPVFPEKRPIALSDKPLFDALFKELQPEISEFTFTNIFCWRLGYEFGISQLEDFIIISSNSAGKLRFANPIGKGNPQSAIKRCLGLFSASEFVRLAQSTAELFSGVPGFKAQECRDDFDYLYRRRDLVELKGTKYDGKRNFIKRFRAQYAPVFRQASHSDSQQCIQFHNQWCNDKDCEKDPGLKKEKQAILEMLANCQELNLLGAVIEIAGKVQAFSLGEKLNNSTFVVHAEKANTRFTGIYQAINNYFASIIPENFQFINREEDLGIKNLRKAKMSYQPIGFVKKYVLSRLRE